MLDYFAGSNVWDALKVAAILTPGAYLRLDRPDRDGPSQTRGLFLEPRLDLDQPNRLSAGLGHHELQRLGGRLTTLPRHLISGLSLPELSSTSPRSPTRSYTISGRPDPKHWRSVRACCNSSPCWACFSFTFDCRASA